MKALKRERISTFQAIILLWAAGISTTMFVLPGFSMNALGRGAWIVPLLGLVLGLYGVFLVGRLSSRFSGHTFAVYSRRIVGRPLGLLFTFLAIVYFLFDVAIGINVMAAIENFSLLPETPPLAIELAVLFSAAYLVSLNIETMVRVAQVVTWILIIPVTVFLIFTPILLPLDVTHLMPPFDFHWSALLSPELLAAVFTFRSFTALAAVTPSLTHPEDATKIGVWSAVPLLPLFLALVVYPLALFGWPTANNYFWPFWQVAILLKVRPVPLQRPIYAMEIAVQAVIFLTVALFLYSAAVFLKETVGFKSHRTSLLILVPVVFLLTRIPSQAIEAYFLIQIWLLYGVVVWILLPTILYLTARVRGMVKRE